MRVFATSIAGSVAGKIEGETRAVAMGIGNLPIKENFPAFAHCGNVYQNFKPLCLDPLPFPGIAVCAGTVGACVPVLSEISCNLLASCLKALFPSSDRERGLGVHRARKHSGNADSSMSWSLVPYCCSSSRLRRPDAGEVSVKADRVTFTYSSRWRIDSSIASPSSSGTSGETKTSSNCSWVVTTAIPRCP